MATKNNPGAFDCYANAEPDEPMFVLLGRDVASPVAVRKWIEERIASGKNTPSDAQIVEALHCITAMERFAEERRAKRLAALKPTEAPGS